jgi:hypothetical protein
MYKLSLVEILLILSLIAALLSILGLAVSKLIKSKLPDWEKVYWIIAFVIFNFIAAVPFIIFHDYFLSREKRANYNSVV